MPKSPHRHFVAAPVLALLLAVSITSPFLQASVVDGKESGSDIQSGATPVSFSVANADLVALPSSHVTHDAGVTLVDGGLVARTPTLFQLHAGDADVLLLMGTAQIAFHQGVLSVASFTGPVVVRQGSRRVAVPAGTQWRGTVGEALPSFTAGWPTWMEARSVQTLPDATVNTLPASVRGPVAAPEVSAHATTFQNLLASLPLDALRLRQSEKQVEAVRRESDMDRFLLHLREKKAAAAKADIQDNPSLLGHASDADIAEALAVVAKDSALQAIITPSLSEHPDLWLLASLHPQTRAAAWVVPASAMTSREHVAVRLLALPYADVLPEAVPEPTMRVWQDEFVAFVNHDRDAQGLASAWLVRAADVLRRLQAKGYPERMMRLRNAAEAVAVGREEMLSAKAAAALEEARTLSLVRVLTDSSAKQAEAAPSIAAARVVAGAVDVKPATDLQAAAYQALKDAGAAFTVQTRMENAGKDAVRVFGIAFGTASGDRLFDLTLNPVTKTVTHVVVDAKMSPFPMEVGAFAKWVMGR